MATNIVGLASWAVAAASSFPAAAVAVVASAAAEAAVSAEVVEVSVVAALREIGNGRDDRTTLAALRHRSA